MKKSKEKVRQVEKCQIQYIATEKVDGEKFA